MSGWLFAWTGLGLVTVASVGLSWAATEVCLPLGALLLLTFVPTRDITEAVRQRVVPSEH